MTEFGTRPDPQDAVMADRLVRDRHHDHAGIGGGIDMDFVRRRLRRERVHRRNRARGNKKSEDDGHAFDRVLRWPSLAIVRVRHVTSPLNRARFCALEDARFHVYLEL